MPRTPYPKLPLANRKCRWCRKRFAPKHHHNVYCPRPECRRARNTEAFRRWASATWTTYQPRE